MTDPTTVALAAQNDERARLRAENDRLSRALASAYTDVEVLTADRDRLSKQVAETFGKGFDQALGEILDHFKKIQQAAIVSEIEKIWMGKKRS